MTSLLDQALKAKDADTFDQWFLSLTSEQREALIAELKIEDYRASQALLDIQKRGPSETK